MIKKIDIGMSVTKKKTTVYFNFFNMQTSDNYFVDYIILESNEFNNLEKSQIELLLENWFIDNNLIFYDNAGIYGYYGLNNDQRMLFKLRFGS